MKKNIYYKVVDVGWVIMDDVRLNEKKKKGTKIDGGYLFYRDTGALKNYGQALSEPQNIHF